MKTFSNTLSKTVVAAIVLGALAGCGSDDVEDFIVDNAGIDVNDDGEATTAAEMVVLSLKLISEEAIACDVGNECDAGSSSIEGKIKVVADGSNWKVTSDDYIEIKSGDKEFKVDLFTDGHYVTLSPFTPPAGSTAPSVYGVTMTKSNFIADEPDSAVFYGETISTFQYDVSAGMFDSNHGGGRLTGEDNDTRTFNYNGGIVLN
ncbi:hypothetical protein [Shewanella sp. Isolate11]|uniref:hypothetical protein n=1 Tax=Shewanella sp. Isolate11 TaxID=2908530 RepID=UPI001EFEDDBF|nr:hypothetical protein [Shewanella sp. Isolate11]MCG9697162.1 hypothetical protein [Shewanella sp. Isolate11]